MIVVTTKRKASMEEDEGCERWVVVMAAFFTQFIVCGVTYSLGVFHVVFKDIFYESHFDTSWIGSILLYVTALSSKLQGCTVRSEADLTAKVQALRKKDQNIDGWLK